MNIRKTTSLTMLLSFIFCILSSTVLYIAPHGRVAYWTDWRLWGLSKTQWSDLHLNLGILLLAAGILHVYYNWQPITAYLKNKTRQLRLLTTDFTIALTITTLVGLGTYFHTPPIGTVLDVSTSIKDSASVKYGEPPYGHAELSSLNMFAKKVDLDPAKAMALLLQAGIQFQDDGRQTLNDIAKGNNLTPQQIYEIMKPAAKLTGSATKSRFPDSPPPGFGNKTISKICGEYGLESGSLLHNLSLEKIHARPGQSIKEIAAANYLEPMQLFERLSGIINTLPPGPNE